MQWFNPMWLWGLSGLAVPVAIHLLSRKEGKVIQVGSLRHLRETTTRQFRSLKPNELLLFVLRSLLVLLLVALLAGLQWEKEAERPKWVLLERGTEVDMQVKRLTDSLVRNGYQLRYLENGFPLDVDTLPGTAGLNYWYLAHQLKSANIQHAVVFSPGFIKNFKGKRESLPGNISWIDVPAGEKTVEISVASAEADGMQTLMGFADAEVLKYERPEGMQSLSPDAYHPPKKVVTIAADEGFEQDAAVLEAAFQVLEESAQFDLEVRRTSNSDSLSGFVFWFSEMPVPESEQLKMVRLQRMAAHRIVEQTGADSWRITKRLNRETALEYNLVVELAEILASDEPRLIAQNDQRVMPESWRWTSVAEEAIEPEQVEPVYTAVDKWLALFFLAVLLTERLVAWRRNQ